MSTNKQTLGFQTEVKQLLQLMIHSLYSNKEIFLRELISNAADAADKLRFEAIKKPELFEDDPDLRIQISLDKEAHTLTISDNGVGMSREELIEHLGTIAKSGTRAFFDKLSGDAQKDANLIGQFGVGFYSAFMVADKVSVTSRRAGLSAKDGACWESNGDGEYSIETVEKTTRGTCITLHLKESEQSRLTEWEIRRIIRTYSDHISIPIEMKKSPTYDEKGEVIESDELEAVNQASALWTRNKNEISDEQYKEFYKHVSHDFNEPLAWSHARVEGKQEYTELLYIPKQAPFDLYNAERTSGGIKLYVRRVFIMEDAERLMPNYLRFVRGVVDSNDLPLNVSREILQESRDIDAIRSGCVKKVLALLESMQQEKAEDYEAFWIAFGQVLKEGVGEDFANKERIAKLLRFASTHNDSDKQNVSLSDYIARMKEAQEKIYYITAETYAAAKNSPHLEVLRKKGIEVLLLSDRVDEWVVNSLNEFEGKQLQSVAKGELDLGKLEDEADKQAQQKAEEDAKPIVEKLKSALAEKVSEVRATARLTDSPACLVVGDNEMSAHLERMFKAAGQKLPENKKPILEINPAHLLLQKLNKETEEKRINNLASLLYDQALLAEGGKLDDPAGFVARMNSLILELSA